MSFRGDLSGRPEGFVPPRADGAKERRIDEQFAKRVDQGHVDRREATDAAHVDAKIEAVPVCRFDKGAQRCGVGGTVDQLKKLLVLEAVYDAEKSFARTRWCKRPGAIGGRHARYEGFPCGCGRLAVPAKQPADGEADVQERARERRECEQTRARRPQELIQRDAGARPRQIDGPDIMKRHAGKKVVNPQLQPFELLSRDLRHRASFVTLLLLFFDLYRITDKTEAVHESSTASRIADNSSRAPLGRRLGLAQDSSPELLRTGWANHPNNHWPHIGEGSHLKC